MSESDQSTHTTLGAMVAEDIPWPIASSAPKMETIEEVHSYPPLTQDEDTFALAIVETSGNIAAAYKMVFGTDSYMPLAKGKELLCKPAIALKIRSITDAVQEASLISVGAHLDQLAKIRDLSVVTGQLKTAYLAERSRGEAVGIYQKHDKGNKGGTANVQVIIQSASKHDENI